MALLDNLRPVLEEQGEFSSLEFLLLQVLGPGAGASVQRQSHGRASSLQQLRLVPSTSLPFRPLHDSRLEAAR
jgi:glutamate---cysteine ligase / carboxylate-amine ligase